METVIFFNILEKNAARLVRKIGLRSMAVSGIPDRISARLEVGSRRLLERKPTLPISPATCGLRRHTPSFRTAQRPSSAYRRQASGYIGQPSAICWPRPGELAQPSLTVRLQVTTARLQPAKRWPPRSPPKARTTAATPKSAPRLGSAIRRPWVPIGRMATALP